MRIRDATDADAPALVELWHSAGLVFRPDHVALELAAVLARDPELVLIAEDEQGITAAVFGTFDGRRGWVNRLATRSDQRGQGQAGAILAELEGRLLAKGCRKVNLLIEPDNAGVAAFYGRYGYTSDELVFMEKWLST
ncbi:MAG TPA: GNAT family N-acetyltransferase [Pseudonocardiaceae bacterium]|jgi:ribosomal protein S18 acetylase RimI-like enzyme|nr:GNAT family N-acetyltransferase [Pseudonocardiaceae bacterium]